ncbi:hypothetical protein KY092_20830, partial [Natronomonas gomsonensis]|uniref:hypothetical protein n=1 Tax=Natronomonas gomsonensis TaxID=1046043 RepID=UPI00227CC8A1
MRRCSSTSKRKSPRGRFDGIPKSFAGTSGSKKGWLVESTDEGTNPRESHALPVAVNAYPSAMAPRA